MWPLSVDHLQTPADVDGSGRDHAAVLDQRELGGAAADVDVENALALVGRYARGARTIGRKHCLHVMAGGGGDEIAALLGQEARDRLRVFAPQCLAGEDHHARVDVCGRDGSLLVGIIDDGAEFDVVDTLLVLIGRERDRRAEQRLASDDVVAAGHLFAQTPQVDLGKDHLRPGRADVDADAGQRDIVGDPERIFLDRPVDKIVVVVVGFAVMDMRQIGAKAVVGYGVAFGGLVGGRHG